MSVGLSAPERETVLLMSDGSAVAVITTWQRRVITRLRNNPEARLLEEWHHGSTVGAKFELPADLVSFRSKRRSASPKAREALEKARRVKRGAAA